MHMTAIIVAMSLARVLALVTNDPVPTTRPAESDANRVDEKRWQQGLQRGGEILHEISALTPEASKEFKVLAYRGESVAFRAVGAPPGSTNDLSTKDGFYLRVVTRHGKDLRPQAVWWEVLVFGKIQQVLPQNKIIVLEVNEEDWKVWQTG